MSRDFHRRTEGLPRRRDQLGSWGALIKKHLAWKVSPPGLERPPFCCGRVSSEWWSNRKISDRQCCIKVADGMTVRENKDHKSNDACLKLAFSKLRGSSGIGSWTCMLLRRPVDSESRHLRGLNQRQPQTQVLMLDQLGTSLLVVIAGLRAYRKPVILHIKMHYALPPAVLYFSKDTIQAFHGQNTNDPSALCKTSWRRNHAYNISLPTTC